MGEIIDRRARKKALTREAIRGVARRLFAEHGFDAVTIADVAREADVAVQTVFNHFSTKEDLFFDGRAPWVDGPADAVRSRRPGVAPLTALRAYILELVETRIGSLGDSDRRCLIATIDGSPSLRAREQDMVIECERKLAAALVDAWGGEQLPCPTDTETMARLIAALWTATGRVLIIDHRPRVAAGADPGATANELRRLGEWILRQLEFSLGTVAGTRHDTGWPRATALRAG